MKDLKESNFYDTIIDQEQKSKKETLIITNDQQHKSTFFIVMLIINASLGSFFWGYSIGVYNPAQKSINAILNIQKNDQQNVEAILTGSLIFGGIFGPLITMLLLKQTSRKNSLILADLIGIIGIVISISYENLWVIVAGRIIQGISSGINSTLVPIYIKEMAPIKLIGITSIVNPISQDGGAFVAFLIGLGYASDPTQENEYWRIAFGFPILTCIIRIICLLTAFSFDTPIGYLIQKKEQEALNVIEKIYIDNEQEHILQDYKNEVKEKQESLSFKGVCNKQQGIQKTTFIAIGLMYLTQLIGQNSMNFYSTKLFNYADNDDSLDSRIYSAICGGSAVFFATLTSVFVQKFGKRKVMISSYSSLILLTFSLGIVYVYLYSQTEQNLSNYDMASTGLWQTNIILLIAFRTNVAFGSCPPLFGYVGDVCKENQIILGKISYWVCTMFIAIMFIEIKFYISFFLFFANALIAWIVTKFVLKETKGLSRKKLAQLYQ